MDPTDGNIPELFRRAAVSNLDFDQSLEIATLLLQLAPGHPELSQMAKNFDNGDSRLDSSEFLKFVEQNETAINITTYADQGSNKLLRGLCVDALIELSDENADWKLSFQEFLKCLNPAFNPPEKSMPNLRNREGVTGPQPSISELRFRSKNHRVDGGVCSDMVPLRDKQVSSGKGVTCTDYSQDVLFHPRPKLLPVISGPTECALEDETYADGAETEVDCNRCVCACGNWVCTAMTCDGKNQKGAQTHTEEEMTRYVEELQKHQETAEKTKRVSTKEI
eukprot:bmy_21650T0